MTYTRVVPKVSGLIYKEIQYNNSDQLIFRHNLYEVQCIYSITAAFLYSTLVEEFILPLKKVLHRLNDITVTEKLFAM